MCIICYKLATYRSKWEKRVFVILVFETSRWKELEDELIP